MHNKLLTKKHQNKKTKNFQIKFLLEPTYTKSQMSQLLEGCNSVLAQQQSGWNQSTRVHGFSAIAILNTRQYTKQKTYASTYQKTSHQH